MQPSQEPAMRVRSVWGESGQLQLQVIGDLDYGTGDTLVAFTILSPVGEWWCWADIFRSCYRINIDLSDVTYIDSTGVRTILHLLQLWEHYGGREEITNGRVQERSLLVLAPRSLCVERIIGVLGVSKAFPGVFP